MKPLNERMKENYEKMRFDGSSFSEFLKATDRICQEMAEEIKDRYLTVNDSKRTDIEIRMSREIARLIFIKEAQK